MHKIKKIKSLIFVLFFAATNYSFTQITKVRGFVYDEVTREPIPYIAITFLGTPAGTISSFNGEYFLETKLPVDTLYLSCVGYIAKKIPIKKGQYQEINLFMEVDNISMEEVIITPGENPAHILLKKIIANKKKNNPDNLPAYQCEIYNKVQVDINNFGDKLQDRKYMKQFKFIFDYVDTSSLSGKPYLPIMISESISDYYYFPKPKKEQEIIKASKVSGLNSESFAEYTGVMYQQLHIYDNFFEVFEPGFVSPIADFGLLYYKYYLIDSMYIDNEFCYKVSFKPKRKRERTFSGYIIVADSTFAIIEAQLRLNKDANINFINDYLAVLNYKKINDSLYFLSKEKHIVDFNINDKSFGFFGNKTTSYSKHKLITALPEDVDKYKVNIVVAEDATDKNEEFWETNRHENLIEKEKGIYEMVDSIKEVPLFKHSYDFVKLITDYYYTIGIFEYGPYYRTFSNNYVEGNRIRVGGKTNKKFSEKVQFSGHLAYGFEDKLYKYGFGTLYMFNKNPRRTLSFDYENDRRQLGQTNNAFKPDNFMTSFLRRTPNKTLTMVEEYKLLLEHEWFQGFSNTISLKYQTIFPVDAVPFNTGQIDKNNFLEFSSLINAEVILYTRFAKEEKFVTGVFDRISLGSEFPIVETELTLGFKGILGSEYNYTKLKVFVSDKIEINPFGHLTYITEAGRIFGNVPYPLLELHKGNETYAYDITAFNMMNYFEFASDTYFSWITEQHFQGFFLNHIPLLRKLGWREIVSARGVIGSLSDKNINVWNIPVTLNSLSKPYLEAGVGIENIFKFFRFDVLWRLSYLDNPNIETFGLRLGLQIIL